MLSRVMKLFLIVTLILPAYGLLAPSKIFAESEPVNLLQNGGFELTAIDSAATSKWQDKLIPSPWIGGFKVENANISVDSTVSHSGSNALLLSGAATSDRASVQNIVPVSAGKSYKLSFWIKTENVAARSSSYGMAIRTQYYSPSAKVGDGPATEKFSGTNDWQYRELYLTAPTGTTRLFVEPILDFSSGKAWVDDVQLVEWNGATGLALDQSTLSLAVADSVQLQAMITPASVADTVVVNWSSSDETIATVHNGLVRAIKPGVVTITAETSDGSHSASAIVSVDASSEVYSELRHKWFDKLTGGTSYDVDDPIIQQYITNLDQSISNDEESGIWDQLEKGVNRTYLWSDLASTTSSAQMSSNFSRIKTLALAYQTIGSSYYLDNHLRDDIIAALAWMYSNRYNAQKSPYDNWYDWEIGAPQTIIDILVLMYDELMTTDVTNYLTAIDRFSANPNYGTILGVTNVPMNGANLLDKALVVTLRGVLGKNSAKIVQGRDAIGKEFDYVQQGDGVYRDGSLVQHATFAYTAGYGGVWLKGAAEMGYLLNDSEWPLTDPRINNIYDWVGQSFEPIIYNGLAMDMVNGRGISRATTGSARGMILTILRLSESAPEPLATQYRSMIKQWVEQDQLTDYYAGSSIYEINLLQQLLNDHSIVPRGPLVKSQLFAGMDKAVHLRENFGLALSMFSTRISSFEFGNGENPKGWYTGTGMTYIYNDDQTQYRDGFWPTVDLFRLPGTTTDGSGKTKTPVAWASTLNTKSWVGGASVDGLYSSVGMDFSLERLTGSDLQGKKSWFMFDDEIVALGAGITASGNNPVETIVDNRKLNQNGDNTLIVNGEELSNASFTQELAVNWANLEGNVPGTDIGYYFPESPTLKVMRETREGSWNDINVNGSTQLLTRHYASLAYQHGTMPTNESYAYVLLPGSNAQATQSYSESPKVEIISNTAEVQAARHTELDLLGANFWSSGSLELLRSHQPASVMLKQDSDIVTLAVSDPTKLQQYIKLELGMTSLAELEADSEITVLQYAPTTIIQVDTSAATGASYTIKLRIDADAGSIDLTDLKPAEGLETIIPVESNTYVEGGDSGNNNYGHVNFLQIRNGTGKYDRKVYLKFDISDFVGEVALAKLYVYGKTNDSKGTVSDIVAYAVEDDEWTQSTLTYNNAPAYGHQVAMNTFSGPEAWREFDVTDYVSEQYDRDQLVSLVLKQMGSDLATDIRSKASEGGIYAPRLELWPKDTTAPVTEVTVQGVLVEPYTYHGDVTVQFNAVDLGNGQANGWGIKRTVYRINEGEWQELSEASTISLEELGQYSIEYRSYDHAGNAENIQSITIHIINNTNEGGETPGEGSGGSPEEGNGETPGEGNGGTPGEGSGSHPPSPGGDNGSSAEQTDNTESQSSYEVSELSSERVDQLANQRLQGGSGVLQPAGQTVQLQVKQEQQWNGVELKLDIQGSIVNEHLIGVYFYNEEQAHWEYVSSQFDQEKQQYIVKADKPGVYSVMEYKSSFADVSDNHWAKQAIDALAARAIVQGVNDTSYAPQKVITRAEFSALLVRMLDIKENITNNPFADVKSDAWYSQAVLAAKQAGIVRGVTEEAFFPDHSISRQEMAVMTVRAIEYKLGALSESIEQQQIQINDNLEIASWALDAVQALYALEVIQGDSQGSFHPLDTATRAEAALVLWRVFALMGQLAQ